MMVTLVSAGALSPQESPKVSFCPCCHWDVPAVLPRAWSTETILIPCTLPAWYVQGMGERRGATRPGEKCLWG